MCTAVSAVDQFILIVVVLIVFIIYVTCRHFELIEKLEFPQSVMIASLNSTVFELNVWNEYVRVFRPCALVFFSYYYLFIPSPNGRNDKVTDLHSCCVLATAAKQLTYFV